MSSPDRQPWILGISASHNGSACLLRGDEIVVAIQEERLSRFKRHRTYGCGPSLSTAYCLNYAGIDPAELDLIVLCVQGRLMDQRHDIGLDPFLKVRSTGVPVLTIPHHYGHAVSVFATSGFAKSAILVVDGAGSPVTDFTAAEKSVLNGHSTGACETISLYYGAGTEVIPLEKHVVDRGAWLVMHDGEMPAFGRSSAGVSVSRTQCHCDFGTNTVGPRRRRNTKRWLRPCRRRWKLLCCTWANTFASSARVIISVMRVEWL